MSVFTTWIFPEGQGGSVHDEGLCLTSDNRLTGTRSSNAVDLCQAYHAGLSTISEGLDVFTLLKTHQLRGAERSKPL